jgi:hypothetical protein
MGRTHDATAWVVAEQLDQTILVHDAGAFPPNTSFQVMTEVLGGRLTSRFVKLGRVDLLADMTNGLGTELVTGLVSKYREVRIRPVIFNGAAAVQIDGRTVKLPKHLMVAALTLAIERRSVRLWPAKSSVEKDVQDRLLSELGSYIEVAATGRRSKYMNDPLRAGHDDMVTALGLAVWWLGANVGVAGWGAPAVSGVGVGRSVPLNVFGKSALHVGR